MMRAPPPIPMARPLPDRSDSCAMLSSLARSLARSLSDCAKPNGRHLRSHCGQSPSGQRLVDHDYYRLRDVALANLAGEEDDPFVNGDGVEDELAAGVDLD